VADRIIQHGVQEQTFVSTMFSFHVCDHCLKNGHLTSSYENTTENTNSKFELHYHQLLMLLSQFKAIHVSVHTTGYSTDTNPYNTIFRLVSNYNKRGNVYIM